MGHEVGDEGVVADQGGDHGCVMVVQPEGCSHGGDEGGAEFGVGDALSFAYVVEEGSQVEQVGSGGSNMVGGTVLGDVEAVLVDGLGVDGFARDEAANVVPGRDEGSPQSMVVEFGNDPGGVVWGGEEGEEITGRGRGPPVGHGRQVGQAGPGGGVDGQSGAGAGRRDTQQKGGVGEVGVAG